MTITITNWADGNWSNCKLVVVKGSVEGCEGSEVTVCCGAGESAGKWPVVDGKFKAVVALRRGKNSIKFVSQSQSRSLVLMYRPNETDLCVVPMYVICSGHDGGFQGPNDIDSSVSSACQRVALGLHLVQTLFAEKLRENQFPRKTFQLESDIDEEAPTCRVFHSQLDVSQAQQLDQETLWAEIGREIMSSELGSDKKKYVAFLSCSFWDGERVLADPALGGGGLALLGTATLHTWPTTLLDLPKCFLNEKTVGPDLLDNSFFRGTYGGCLSTSLGAVCHEMGHMFNLGHTQWGIMARGFDNVERVFLAVPKPKEEELVTATSQMVLVPNLTVGSGNASARHAEESTPKSNTVDDDLTSFTSACACILAHHRWFNHRPATTSTVTYDQIRHIVSSVNGLKVVQLRGLKGLVVKSWELGSKSPCKHLILPRLNMSPISLVAIDSTGSILTRDLQS